ncbi:MAG: PAS domain-containing sensor histidine kinase [Magnetococcales bacterium]|nr:PAS domain-containing sensor histidine kinase [Magnetococcales bacterium]
MTETTKGAVPPVDDWSDEGTYNRHLIDIAADMVVSVNRERLVNLFNKKAEEVYGYTASEILGQPITRLYDNLEEYQTVGALLQQQGRYVGEVTGRKKNGESFPVFITAILLHNAEGAVIGSVGYSRDLTAEKKAAALEREYIAMLGEEKLKKEVEHITRHDMKSPLNSIIGFADLLLHEETLGEEHREIAQIIYNSGMKALRMVNLSLDLLKIEQGRYTPTPEPVKLLPVLLDVQTDHANLLRGKRLTVTLRLNDTPCSLAEAQAQKQAWVVLGEETMCYNIFANLFKNATEASPPDSVIALRLCSTPERVALSIHNQGAVPSAIRDHFFEKSVTFGKKDGTGLGTYSARQLTITLGGEIELESTEEEGTTLTVTLPAASPEAIEMASRRPAVLRP